MTRARTPVLCILLTLGAVMAALPLRAVQAAPAVPVSSNLGCDPLDPAACLLPFPNDLFTVEDPSTDTGRRVDLNVLAMPRSGAEVTEGGEGKPVDPTEWNRNDGFSPGSMVMTYVPGIDLHATWGTQDRPHSDVGINEAGYFDYRDHITDIGLYEEPDAPFVILNADTLERHPFWSELDTHPLSVAAGEQVLMLRPAVNFEEGQRYIVAMRGLKGSDESVIAPRPEFSAYVGGAGADADRQGHFDDNIFEPLERAGIAKDDLYLAWDFTVASERNLAERILHIRDDAFGRILGDTDLADRKVAGVSPEFVVDATGARTDTWTDSRGVAHSEDIRIIEGRVTVPNYLDRPQQTEGHVRGNQLPYDPPVPGSRFLDLNLDGLPDQNPVESEVQVPFTCELPLNGKENLGLLYGHGLLGDRGQVDDTESPRRNGPFLGCAADWWGMSTPDIPTIATIIADMSGFPSLADRAQQGFLNFMFLGRAIVHPDGFATDPAFQTDTGAPLVKTAQGDDTPLFYDGNSQGGIMGGSLVAVSPDISRGILGVPGMNYSTLLTRSVDWEDLYAIPYYEVYRDPIERNLGFALMQMLWDRGEANGYAAHMTTDPYPNTPPHEVMLQVAFADHQVTNVAAEVEARTIGAPIMTPGLPDGRHWEMDPYFQDHSAAYPYKGSALVYWDSGNATPPNGNVPADHSSDPHSHPRSEPAASWQEAQFLLTGWMEDVCNGGFYLTDNHPANAGRRSCVEPAYAPGSQIPDPVSKDTTITLTGSSAGGQYSDDSVLEARLTDSAGAPVTNAPVEFELSDGDSTRTFQALTDGDGIARVTAALDQRPGLYFLRAGFAGDEGHDASEATMPFVIDREDTAASLSRQGRGTRSSLVAALTDLDSGAGVAERAIEFWADGSLLGSASTDGTGTATFQLPPAYRGGPHEFEARFVGDDFYRPSTAALST